MRFPHHLLQASTYRSEPVMAAMAAIAVGMFVGTWVIGPAITHTSEDAPASPSISQPRPTIDAMLARPDPPPYRAATPAFDMSGPPTYAAAAKEQARAELGGQVAESDFAAQAPDRTPRWRGRYRQFDRHTGAF